MHFSDNRCCAETSGAETICAPRHPASLLTSVVPITSVFMVSTEVKLFVAASCSPPTVSPPRLFRLGKYLSVMMFIMSLKREVSAGQIVLRRKPLRQPAKSPVLIAQRRTAMTPVFRAQRRVAKPPLWMRQSRVAKLLHFMRQSRAEKSPHSMPQSLAEKRPLSTAQSLAEKRPHSMVQS